MNSWERVKSENAGRTHYVFGTVSWTVSEQNAMVMQWFSRAWVHSERQNYCRTLLFGCVPASLLCRALVGEERGVGSEN